jgi:histone deacetylase 6
MGVQNLSWNGCLVSAGFDAAEGDTLGMCDVTPSCYAHMTALLSTLAGGKVVVALEVSWAFWSTVSCR